MRLKSAHFYYGTSRYPMQLGCREMIGYDWNQLPDGLLEEELLDKLSHDLFKLSGNMLSPGIFRDRIKQVHMTQDRLCALVPEEHRSLLESLRPYVSVYGDGFHITWECEK